MSKQWYLSRQGQRYGPYSWEQLSELTRSGQVVPQDLIWSGLTRMPGPCQKGSSFYHK